MIKLLDANRSLSLQVHPDERDCRELFPSERNPADRENERQISRLLEARSALGFGKNCHGPVNDLAIASDGSYVGFTATGHGASEIRVIDFSSATPLTTIESQGINSPAFT